MSSIAESHVAPLKPPGTREFTLRAVITSILVSALIGAAYPYVVLKLGFGPNISVVSAFFGFLALGIASRDFNRWENNIVQSAGTAAGGTAFLCVLLAAFDMLGADTTLAFHVNPTPLQAFLWLTVAGLLGVFLAVPMRQHFVVEEKLVYADGVAAAETLIVLDSRDGGSKAAARSMGVGTLLSALVMTLREDGRLLGAVWYRIPEMLRLGPTGATMGVGVSWSFLSLGAGMLVGLRVNLSMFLGLLLSWVIAPPLLMDHGIIDELRRQKVLLWVMWPATGMLVAGGLTALFLKWHLLVKTFKNLSGAAVGGGDFPMRWVAIGTAVCTIALVILQQVSFHQHWWMTLVAVLLSIPLMLVGLRVLGETNWGPISALSNMMQAIFGMLAPGQVAPNMVASGVTGTIASQSEGLMQTYKTGEMIGSTPKYLTWAQLLAVPIGALTVSYVYPLLRNTYGIGGENGLQSPISQKWAGFAKLLAGGLSALPPHALEATVIGVALGILFTVLEGTKAKKWTPSPTGIGIGMLVPASAVATMVLGAVVAEIWTRTNAKSADRHLTPLASGFIAGEAIIAVIIPVLVTLKIVNLQ